LSARLAFASILVCVLAACGGSKGSSAAPTAPVEPAVYARSVCGALVKWDEAVSPAFGAKSKGSNDSATIRKEFLDLFASVEHATDNLGKQLDKAGAPKVAGGEGVARRLRDTVAGASRKLQANRVGFAAIRVTDVEPTIHVEEAMIAQGEQMDAVEGSLEGFDGTPELRQARERDPACTAFSKKK